MASQPDTTKTRLAVNSQGDVKEMKFVQGFAVSVMGAAFVMLVSACGTDSKETTTYVPVPPPQVVVQAPAVVPPPPPTTTTSTSSDRASYSTSSEPGTGST